jgi:uncharacterized protein (TIGR02302 family)
MGQAPVAPTAMGQAPPGHAPGDTGPAAGPPPALRRLRDATRFVLWLERASAALWPALGLLGGFLCLALYAVPQVLPAWLHVTLLLAIVLATGWAVWRVRPALAWPGQDVADRRLERVAGLAHRPLAVLADRPAGEGGEVWGWHQARALAQVARLRFGWPGPAFPARDPRALRLLLLLGLTIGVVVAGPDAGDRLLGALTPRFAPRVAPIPLEIRGWVTPPAATFLPPTLLPDGGDVVLPAGSRVTIGVSGGDGGVPELVFEDHTRGFETIGGDSYQIQAEPARDGAMLVRRDGSRVAMWRVSVRPDVAPAAVWAKPPVALRERVPPIRLSWRATHAYGVVGLAAEFRLRARPAAPPLLVTIPLSGHPREAVGSTTTDLTAHPWAGLPVLATLAARDGAGLVGHSEAVAFVLPQRHFRQPGAQAIVAIRQMLALAPGDGRGAAEAMRGAAARPLWPDGDPAPDTLRGIAATLGDAPADATVDAVQTKLWELALRLEEGTVPRSIEALRRAQRDLHAALDPAAPRQTRDKAEIERRAQALDKAMQRLEQALAQQAKRDPLSATPISPGDARAAEQKLQQLRDAARADRDNEARDRMAELDQMLDAMRQSGRSTAQRQRDEAREKGRQQMSVLQDLVRRQAAQIDHAESRLAAPAQTDQQPARDHDRLVQLALRRVLGELMQEHGDLTGSIPKNLGEADGAMRDAANALAEARDDRASAAALRAVEALQQGGQAMDQSLAQKFGATQPGDGDQQGDADGQDGDGGQQAMGEGQDPGDGIGDGTTGEADGEGDGHGFTLGPDGRPLGRHLDPFGRALHEGVMGSDGGRDTHIPEEMEKARGRAVQEELRRREAQRTRPQEELDYIGRLLKQD